MLYALPTACFLLLPLAAAPPAAPPAGASQDPPDEREDIAAQLEAFEEHAGEDGDEDREAIAIVDALLQEWPNLGPKDREDVVETLGDAFQEKRDQRDDGTWDDALYVAVAVALGEMGDEDAAEELERWIGHKRHRDNRGLQRTLILALGRTREPDGLKTLVDLLKHSDPLIQGAGAEALGDFETADGETRKEIFEAVLKQIVPLHSDVTTDTSGDAILRERYDTVAGPMIATLRRVSGHEERDPLKFQRWWNKNKKSDWDERS